MIMMRMSMVVMGVGVMAAVYLTLTFMLFLVVLTGYF
jgi:hypothetical protein